MTAKGIEADAIVAYTHSGNTVNMISGLRPACPIIAITDNQKTYHKLSLSQNVTPIYVETKSTINETRSQGILELEKQGILEKGDLVVFAGGDPILPKEKESITFGGIMRI